MREAVMPFEQDQAKNRAADSILPISANALVMERDGRRLIDNLSLDFDGQGISVILGPNGAGKSLLLRQLAGLLKPDAGKVTWAGRAPSQERVRRLGFVFQKPVLLRRSALANIKYALAAHQVPLGLRGKKAEEALQRAGLLERADQAARLLSGGEQQRLALARALACDPEVLILDEPTASVDPSSTLAIERMVRGAAGLGAKIILVTHDIGQAQRLADEVIFLHHGRLVERTPARRFFQEPKSLEAAAYLRGDILL